MVDVVQQQGMYDDCAFQNSWVCSFSVGFVNATLHGKKEESIVQPLVAFTEATYSRALVAAAKTLSHAGVHCASMHIDLSSCAWKRRIKLERFRSKADMAPYWPQIIAHQIMFWAATLASDQTCIKVRDLYGLLRDGILESVSSEGGDRVRFNSYFLESARNTDIVSALRIASMDWFLPFEALPEPHLPSVTSTGEDEASLLKRMLLFKTGRQSRDGLDDNITLSTATRPHLRVLVEEVATVVRALDAGFIEVLRERTGLIVGRDTSLRWFADACAFLWNGSQCSFLDASQLRASDTIESRTPGYALQGIKATGQHLRFVIILPLGRHAIAEPEYAYGDGVGLGTHPRGDMLLLNLVRSMFAPFGGWVFNFHLVRRGHPDSIVLNIVPERQTKKVVGYRFVSIVGVGKVSERDADTAVIDIGPRTRILMNGWNVGPMRWLRGALRGVGRHRELALRFWGCGSCALLPFESRVGILMFAMQPAPNKSPMLWLLDIARPLRAQDATIFISFPGSGQTVSRLSAEVISGRPTGNLYEFSKEWSQTSLCNCFGEVQAMRRFAPCQGQPIMYVHHNLDFFTATDPSTVRGLAISMRDYSALIRNTLLAYNVTDVMRFLRQTVYEYLSILDIYERFHGPKQLLFFDEIVKDPDKAAARLATVMGIAGQDRDEGLKRWRTARLELFDEISDWCARQTLSHLHPACGAPCRNFMKSQKKGPWAHLSGKQAHEEWAAQSQGLDVVRLTLTNATGLVHNTSRTMQEAHSDDFIFSMQVRDATRTFEALLCPGPDSDPQDQATAKELRSQTLALKYLVHPGWGSGGLGARCDTVMRSLQ